MKDTKDNFEDILVGIQETNKARGATKNLL